VFPSPRRERRLYGEQQNLVSFASNDYLGLAADRDLLAEVFESVPERFGSSGSRLLGGDLAAHHILEEAISAGLGTEAGLSFNSGYHTNVGILSAVLEKQDVVFADKFCHASIIDGILLSGAKLIRYKHNDLDHLESLLSTHRNTYNDALIVTESCFSMDGDLADIERLVALKKSFSCKLYIDEAHAIGVLGPNGYGLCVSHAQDIDFIVGGFGKALGSCGGYLGCSDTIKQFLINSCRSFIYSTSLPLPVLKWNTSVWTQLPQFQDRRESLQSLITWLSSTYPEITSPSHISPIIIGDDDTALSLAKTLETEGFFVAAIRPPTVPENTSRLRLSLSSTHTQVQLEGVLNCVREYI